MGTARARWGGASARRGGAGKDAKSTSGALSTVVSVLGEGYASRTSGAYAKLFFIFMI